jgi:predicted CXXCH cytochrome family protein
VFVIPRVFAIPVAAAGLLAAADSGYVPSAICAGCHLEIARSYALTGMGRSIYPARAENKVEDFETRNSLYHAASNRYYTMIERDAKVFERRHQTGFDGKETNVIEEQADFVIGSGNHVRSYLHRTQQGRLVELPVSWYAGNGGYWAMSPGYDTPGHLDFRRTVSYECIFCHAAYPAAVPASNFSGADSIFGNAALESIDCQRCHGPGRAHIEAAARASGSRESIRGSILNPARLSRDRQMDLCMQCHLETTTSFPIASIRRFNREPFSYRPGEPLGDFAVFFDQAPGSSRDTKFELVHAAYGLRKSACFRASQMTCSTCHNPHQVPARARAAEHYSALCRSCHAAAHASGMPAGDGVRSSCLDCHMPKRRTDDVVHAVMTDHYIRRSLPAGDFLAPRRETHEPYRGEVMLYYPSQTTPENELYLAVAQVRYSADLARGIPRLQLVIERQRLAQQSVRPEFYFELGVAYWKHGRTQDAIRWYSEALRHGDYRPALKALGEALLAAGQLTQAASVLERALAGDPADTDVLYALGSLYFRQNKLDPSGRALQQALSINPDLPQARNLQGVVQGRTGNRTAAAEAFRDAIRIQPDFDLAHINLALLLAADGDYAQAAYHLEQAKLGRIRN